VKLVQFCALCKFVRNGFRAENLCKFVRKKSDRFYTCRSTFSAALTGLPVWFYNSHGLHEERRSLNGFAWHTILFGVTKLKSEMIIKQLPLALALARRFVNGLWF